MDRRDLSLILSTMILLLVIVNKSDSYLLKLCINEQEPFSMTCEFDAKVNITNYVVNYVTKNAPDHDCFSPSAFKVSLPTFVAELQSYCDTDKRQYVCTLSNKAVNDLFSRNYGVRDPILFALPNRIELAYECTNSTGNYATRAMSTISMRQSLFISMSLIILFSYFIF